jgi:hypothetical protein
MESYDELLDAVELQMHLNGLVQIKPISIFTPGLYTRTIVIPPDTYLLSHIHKTEHQFFLSKGEIVIYNREDDGKLTMTQYGGPWIDITYPNTRRFAKTLTETVWTSIHATNILPEDNSEKALIQAEILVEKELYEKRENIFLISYKERSELCPA